ncbi:MAG: hypothetical protein QM536_03410 [Chitinophagaceae bacterium]|nr:hypothetical protein [Chitinophagaceae bacterium]
MKKKIHIVFTLLVFYCNYQGYSQANGIDSGVYFIVLKNKMELFGTFLEKTEEKMIFSDMIIKQIEISPSNIEEVTRVYPNAMCIFKTNNGKTFQGYFLKLDKDEISFLDNLKGKTILKISQLMSVQPVKLSNLTKELVVNEQKNIYYCYAKSLIPLKEGEMYYQNNLIFANAFHFRINQNVSMGVGTFFIPLPFIFGYGFLYINPQFSFPIAKNLYVGGGVWGFYTPFIINSFSLIGYGTITYGNERSNISVSIGANTEYRTYSGFRMYEYPFVSLSGSLSITPNTSIIAENAFSSLTTLGSFNTFSLGARYGKKNHAFDFGVKVVGMETSFLEYPIPYIGYSLKIVTKKKNI